MLKSSEVKRLLVNLITFRNIGDAWLQTIPSEIRSPFYENPYTNNILMGHDTLLNFALGDLTDDVMWFLYDWRPGFSIKVDEKEYIINDLDDYIQYLEAENLVSK